MMYDWSGVEWLGAWTSDEAQAFAARVEAIAIEEAERLARLAPADEPGAAS